MPQTLMKTLFEIVYEALLQMAHEAPERTKERVTESGKHAGEFGTCRRFLSKDNSSN